ncbi:hypothetical protein EQ836_07590 [Ectopseudomonas mendocina]|uniref:DUF2570 domain-containing protein n=1 Tax=Ectopseudomonas mendocina TaxID=300 RepID=A0ABD7RY90_ECTME|nr:hypothetical protein [Pseudomonas mendocina]TRO14328.1 hypothetical protein EQ829_09985 [Pseudomonas mendocina]TRO19379.1 hypothetical protein EQ836_07590 [Pseudomonas mendocina]
MSAWLKLVPAWGWSVVGGLVLAALIGLGQQIRINSLQGDLATERQARLEDAGKLGACRTTRTNLLGQVIEQNAALADLRASAMERAARAKDLQQQAEVEAQQADQQAQLVLQERSPAGADVCAAASAAFDAELKRERGL